MAGVVAIRGSVLRASVASVVISVVLFVYAFGAMVGMEAGIVRGWGESRQRLWRHYGIRNVIVAVDKSQQ